MESWYRKNVIILAEWNVFIDYRRNKSVDLKDENFVQFFFMAFRVAAI